MALLTPLIIFVYFLIRVALQYSDFEKTKRVYSTRMYKVALAYGLLAVGALSYWFELLDYNSCEWCMPPIPVYVFLGWLVVVVIDSLHQFQMMGSTQLESESRIDQEENGTLKQ